MSGSRNRSAQSRVLTIWNNDYFKRVPGRIFSRYLSPSSAESRISCLIGHPAFPQGEGTPPPASLL